MASDLTDASGVVVFRGTITPAPTQTVFGIPSTVNTANLAVGPGAQIGSWGFPADSTIIIVTFFARIRNAQPNILAHDLHFTCDGAMNGAMDVTVQPGTDETVGGVWTTQTTTGFMLGIDDQAGADVSPCFAVVAMTGTIGSL